MLIVIIWNKVTEISIYCIKLTPNDIIQNYGVVLSKNYRVVKVLVWSKYIS